MPTPEIGTVWTLTQAVRTTKDGPKRFVERLDRNNPQAVWEWADKEAQTVRYRGKIGER